jgi:N-acetylglucosaminyl-diphospho-decaprenol L-rhamnosyltransferase
MQCDLSIIIVSYNTRTLSLVCLRSVYEQTSGVSFEVLVVDNASSDGSAQAIAAQFPQVRLIPLDKNVGFARANNIAAKHALAPYLLLLNPDTRILDGSIQKTLNFARSCSGPCIVGGRTYYPDGSLNYSSCHGRPTLWSLLCMGCGLSSLFRCSRIFDPESLGRWERDTTREVDVITGCFLLIERGLWERLKGFDENFFMYGEDTDLCIRARNIGVRCINFADARLIHHGGASEKVRPDKMIRLFQAKAQLFRKHWAPSSVWLGMVLLRMWALTRMTALSLLRLVAKRYEASYQSWREIWRRSAEFTASVASASEVRQ